MFETHDTNALWRHVLHQDNDWCYSTTALRLAVPRPSHILVRVGVSD